MSGFVYILSNPNIPNLVKIGKSDRDPSQGRVEELYTTGVPTPFKVEYFAYVRDHHSAERLVHSKLSAHRPNMSREFFGVDIEHAIFIIREHSEILYEENIYKSEEEIKKYRNEQRQKEKQQVIKKAEELRASKQRLEDLQRENKLKEEAKEAESERESIVREKARGIINLERKKYLNSFPSKKLWKWYLALTTGWSIVYLLFILINTTGSKPVSNALLLIFLLYGIFAFFTYIFDRIARQERAEDIFNEALLLDITSSIMKGKNFTEIIPSRIRFYHARINYK